MRPFGEQLRYWRMVRGFSQRELAGALSVSQQALAKWEAGASSPNPPTLARIAAALDIPVAKLFGEAGTVRIPVLGRVQAGVPIEAVEAVYGEEEITAELADSGSFFALLVKGDSMEPRLVEGDVVIVRAQSSIESGEVGIFLIGGESATIKRVVRHREGITLTAYNPNYPPLFFSNAEIEAGPVRVIGKVVELRAKF